MTETVCVMGEFRAWPRGQGSVLTFSKLPIAIAPALFHLDTKKVQIMLRDQPGEKIYRQIHHT